MSGVTVEPDELKQAADYQLRAAAEAGVGVQATESVDLRGRLYETHGLISGLSNEAISGRAGVREEAGRAIQQACLTLAAALNTAAACYTDTDSDAGGNLDNQMQS
ncbi:hypothetical protein A5641_10410 [Mycobacterium sp. 1554424.7]|nr:hypothetical protein A5641_10410 [Mycobacterium sp. 1554424.7]